MIRTQQTLFSIMDFTVYLKLIDAAFLHDHKMGRLKRTIYDWWGNSGMFRTL